MALPVRVSEFLPVEAPKPFRLSERQRYAWTMLGGDAVHFMLYGGARSGKTFLLVRALIIRALLAPGSRHLMVRFRFAHIMSSIVADTFPKVIDLCFPELKGRVDHKKSEHYYILPNGSEIWYAGLDDKDRAEKVLGQEYATILVEECSQIPFASRGLLVSRLAQKVRIVTYVDGKDGKPVATLGDELRNKMFYAENPPLKSHWTYKLFIQKLSPDSMKPLPNPANFNSYRINPRDNAENISSVLLSELDNLGERQRKRFRDGEFGEAGEEALWTYELIEQQRLAEVPTLDEFVRIVVAIDPSGAESADDVARDEIGIVVAGLKKDGTCVVLEDATFLGSPKQWAQMAIERARVWEADTVVAETNYGGAMVKAVVQAAMVDLNYPVKIVNVTATRGKHVRAEPISALYEQQKIWHSPGLERLEDELCQFTTYGFTGDRSPNRADAAVWALSFLFPNVLKAGKELNNGRGIVASGVNLGYDRIKRLRRG